MLLTAATDAAAPIPSPAPIYCRKRATLSRAFASWLRMHSTLRAGRTLTVALLARRAVTTLRHWCDAALEQRGAKNVAMRLGPALVAGGPPAEFTRRCKRAVMRWRRMDLAPAWTAWRAYFDERRRKRGLAATADALYRRRVESRHLDAWTSVAAVQQRWRGRFVAQAFHAWVSAVHAASMRRAHDAALVSLVSRARAAALGRFVLRRMLVLAAEAEGRRLEADRMFVAQQMRLCAETLSAWRAIREHRAMTRGFGQLLAARLLQRAGSRILAVWQAAASHERWARDRADSFRLRKLLTVAWGSWASYAGQRRRAKRGYKRAAEMWAGLRANRARHAVLHWFQW